VKIDIDQERERGLKTTWKHTATVQRHATSTRQLVVLPALLLNQLLGHGVSRREEHSGGDALGQDRARGQLHLVPRSRFVNALLCNTKRNSELDQQGENVPS
jgi:hypothetical protein